MDKVIKLERKGIKCPYCGTPISPPPKRKKKCKECGNYIYYRSNSFNGRKFWLTEEEKERYDKNRPPGMSRYRSLVLRQWGMPEDELEARKAEFIKSHAQPEAHVFYKITLQQMLTDERFKADRDDINYSQARLSFELGHPTFFPLLQRIRKKELNKAIREAKSLNSTHIQIMGPVGETCRKLMKQYYTLEEAKELQPLPNPQCIHQLTEEQVAQGMKGFCMCSYMPSLEHIARDPDMYKQSSTSRSTNQRDLTKQTGYAVVAAVLLVFCLVIMALC